MEVAFHHLNGRKIGQNLRGHGIDGNTLEVHRFIPIGLINVKDNRDNLRITARVLDR